MKSSLRGRFAIAAIVIAAAGFLFFDVILYRTVRGYLTTQALRELRGNTRLAQILVEREAMRGAEEESELWALTYRLREITQARVTLIADDGRVLTDSDVGPEGVPHMANHGDRPEVQQAGREGMGLCLRPSATLGRRLYYSAARVDNHALPVRFVRLAYYAEHLEQSLHDVLFILIGGTLLGVVLVGALAVLLSGAITRPLRKIIEACRQLETGEDRANFPVQWRGELGELALSVQNVFSRFQERTSAGQATEARLLQVLEHLACGALLVDEHRRVLHANRAVFRLLEEDEVPVAGRNLVELVRSADILGAVSHVLANGGTVEGELAVFSGERRRWIAYRASAIGAGAENVCHALVELRDITELKHLEEIRRDFVANASHELKTPLTAIVGYTETLLADWERMSAEQRVRYLRRIREQAQRLEFLTSDLLTLAESEEKVTPTLVPYPVHRLLRGIAEEFAERATEKGIELKVKADRRLKALMDPDAMHIVLSNLVDNAIKYTGAGGSVTVSAKGAPPGEVLVEVVDTGVGIDPRHHLRIFERFYRVDKSRSRAMGGTGLGLAIVKHIVEKHGSRVQVESELGRGSRFWFMLRAA
ncbi:MAG: ATP-binding protein [candidate division KSB1 bacterium]|nr:ATP-binding protein [candidate division KSB1 bacterium]